MAVDRRDDVLQRGERFALPADQHVAVFAGQVDADAVRHLLRLGLEVEVHRVDDFLDERGDVRCGHDCLCAVCACCGPILPQACAGAPIR